MRVELTETCIYPEPRANEKYAIVIHGKQSERSEPRLKDVLVRDKDNLPIYRNYRERQLPVYERPFGFAILERNRATDRWPTSICIPAQTAGFVPAVLGDSTLRPIYFTRTQA